MEKFRYRAKRGVKEVVEGILEAQNQEEAVKKLFAQELVPLEVVKVVSDESKINKYQVGGSFRKTSLTSLLYKFLPRRVSFKELLIFTRKLTTLTRAKLELLLSLKVISEQTDNPLFKNIIEDIYQNVKEGRTFSQALEMHRDVFSPLFVSIVKAGEASGTMEKALEQLSDFLQKRYVLKRKVAGALVYPAVLTLVGFSSVWVILNFVIPRLQRVFLEVKVPLPFMTRLILKLSDFSTHQPSLLVVLLVVSVIFVLSRKMHWVGVRKVAMHLPLLRRLIKNQELANFSRSLSLLIGNGVPILKALQIASASIGDLRARRQLDRIGERVKEGERLSQSMESLDTFPPFFIKMVAIGEESGRLAEVLDEISRDYIEQIEEDIGIISSLLEPALILILGIILGSIILSILLPIFQVTQMIH